MKPTELHTLLQDSILTDKPLINPYLQAPPKGTIADRVAIYSNGFYARLEEALMSDYESLAAIMGEEAFSSLCRAYLLAYPSYNFSLNFLGVNLSRFLTATPPYNKQPYLAEIAAFEWAEYQAVIASDATLLSASDLQSLPASQWPDLTFCLHPSCHLISLQWNSLAILQASRANKALPKPKQLKTSHSVLIWRRQQEVRYCQLNNSEYGMLNAVKNKATFMAICEDLSQLMAEEEVAGYVAQELNNWLQEQIFML